MMRRPSRQGLLSLCTCGRNALLPACLIIFNTLIGIPRDAYTQDVPSLLSDYFSKVVDGNAGAPPLNVLTATPYQTTFALLRPYLHDTVSSVRSMAFEILHLIGSSSSEREVRGDAVELLLRAYGESESGMKGNILTYLKRYSREDFSMTSRGIVGTLVRKQPMYFDQILKLAGFLNLTDLTSEIRPWTQPGNPVHVRWAASLSLARMGDSFAIAAIYDRIRNVDVNDDAVYQVLPDLIYTRQPSLYSYMVEALQTKENSCMSADPEREIPIPCGYRIMELLAPVIDGFPFILAPGGDLDVPDYAIALEKVRAWFQTNKTYNILNDTY